MNLGCECLGDRVQNVATIKQDLTVGLLAGALGLDGAANHVLADAKGLGDRQDRSAVGTLHSPSEQGCHRLRSNAGSLAPGGELALLDEREQEVVEGGGGGPVSLGHAGTCSGTEEKKRDVLLDFSGETVETVCINNAPTAANFLRRTAAGADPTPEDQMTDTVTTPPTAEQLKLAKAVLDRATDDVDASLLADLKRSIEAADDGWYLDGCVYEVQMAMGELCEHCRDEIEPGTHYCSKWCWLADGGDS